MATKKKTVKKSGNAKEWGIGGALTAATLAAAAGAYLLSNKKTKAKAKKWATEARKEIVKNTKMAKKLGEKEYAHIVDETLKHHAALENLTAADVIKEGKALKAEWKKIQAEAKKMAKAYAPKKAAAKKKPAHKAKAAKKARG
jgi:predicted RND superfamily exporter protein